MKCQAEVSIRINVGNAMADPTDRENETYLRELLERAAPVLEGDLRKYDPHNLGFNRCDEES